jgi:ABC-type lipoprotein export system ATPase subunit
MMGVYFKIKNLKCSYACKATFPKVVLQVDELCIPKGEVAFIVGKSGCGKSTILETLGLMNNTILSADQFLIFPEEGKEIDVTKVWRLKNSVLSDIRKKYFSFIFQQTNLMQNFSIRENAVIPQLIKGGDKKYSDTLLQVGLEQIGENRQKVSELSGGQQQRLAFVRAFMPNFNLIFGDEPTGNLDPQNADNLMKIIADEIHKSAGKTAIIVSHSPDLSEKYADRIINIHKKETQNGDTFGQIDDESIFEKRNGKWFHDGTEISSERLLTILREG